MVKRDYDDYDVSCSPLCAGMDYLEDVRRHEEWMNGLSHKEEEDDYYESCFPLCAGMDYLRDCEK